LFAGPPSRAPAGSGRGLKKQSASITAAEADILGRRFSIGDVPTEHARPDDDDVKGITAVVADLGPSATRPAAEKVMRERSLLNIHESVRIWVKAGQHRASYPTSCC
jgi:hypothetical protein